MHILSLDNFVELEYEKNLWIIGENVDKIILQMLINVKLLNSALFTLKKFIGIQTSIPKQLYKWLKIVYQSKIKQKSFKFY